MQSRLGILLLLLLLVQPFVFLHVPNLFPQAASTPQAVPEQPNGQPLPPGNVTYTNTWNTSLRQRCPAQKVTPQPLTPSLTDWKINLSIPSLLFSGKPAGNLIQQSFVVGVNGSFGVRDGAGNDFGWSPLSGLPSGVVSTSLLTNSTAAIQSYVVTKGLSNLASVTVEYTIRKQFCYLAGLEINIVGTVAWVNGGNGTLGLRFNDPASRPVRSEVSFGNSSGISLGFNWNDSLPYRPQFNVTADSLTWSVGSSFKIDPRTVGTTSDYNKYTNQPRVCFGAGRYWVWFFDGTNLVYSSSVDGISWSSTTSVGASTSGGGVVVCSGTKVYYVRVPYRSYYFYSRYGTMNPDGSILWIISEAAVAPSSYLDYPNMAVSSNGTLWVTTGSYPDGHLILSKYAAGSWTQRSTPGYEGPNAILLMSSGIAIVQGADAATYPPYSSVSIFYSSDGGKTWSSPLSTPLTNLRFSTGSAIAIGNNAYVLAYEASPSSVILLQWPWGSTAWYGGNSVFSSPCCYAEGYLATDGSLLVAGLISEGTSGVYYRTSNNGGVNWSPLAAISSTESYVLWLTGSPVLAGENVMLMWESTGAFPYSIRFTAFPVVAPSAALSPQSWSRPGLSPYETYFGHFFEYVSPGNGLLGIRQDDLRLSGRGLDLVVGRVFSTPYAFQSKTPYLYDNYSLANIGLGWQLNFPWLGANYLHLTDGQAYPYAWAGNVFERHGSADFKLVNNSGTGYTLYMPDGTQFQFDSQKKLSFVTDHTGNNTLSFTYSNGRISQIADAVGRAAALSYDGNGHLSSLTYGSRVWSYGYSGNNLVSVADPLGRITTYQYNTGINTWLVSAVIYPTGGKATFTYGSALVGTEVTTYYVTLANDYYSATGISKSTSTSYNIVNGQVVWANSTISDGTVTRGYENYNFRGMENLMKQYHKDSSGNLIQVDESDYNALGRVNSTKSYSPTGILLSYSLGKYDSWGNTIYHRDLIGHESWFSYANTDSSNKFNTTGFSNNFYTNSVSSNIHNAVVGSAEYQSGSISLDNRFGNGVDGSVTITSNTQLTRNMNYSNLAVNTGQTLDTCGHIVRATGSLIVQGTITDTCSGGNGGNGGVAGVWNTCGAGYNGCPGGAGSLGGSGTCMTLAGQTYCSGQGGGGGGGGGSGAASAVCQGVSGGAGGNGGKGGGLVFVFATWISVYSTGSISAAGLAGSNGQDGVPQWNSAFGAGGGGGGGGQAGFGGALLLAYTYITNYGTITSSLGIEGAAGKGGLTQGIPCSSQVTYTGGAGAAGAGGGGQGGWGGNCPPSGCTSGMPGGPGSGGTAGKDELT